MERKTHTNGYEVRTIVAGDGETRASFLPEKGGMASSIVVPTARGGRELLFLHDFFWERQTDRIPGGWPFLFPICGRLERGGEKGKYLFDGTVYSLPSHGFGPRLPWALLESGRADTLILRLEDTGETRRAYPFRFEVTLAYRVEPGVLICEQAYRNTGNVPMPYYAGFHPYFLTPGPGEGKEAVTLDYKPVATYLANPQLTDIVATGAPPPMPLPITALGFNDRLTGVGADKETRLILPGGFTIHLAAEGLEEPDLFPYVQVYTMPDKPFFCVEPWMGFPNALNTVRGARWLSPGAEERGVLRLWTTEAMEDE